MVDGQGPHATEYLLGVQGRAGRFHGDAENDELVVIEACDDVARASHGRRDRLADLTQHVVRRHASEDLDVGPERVEIEAHRRDLARVALRDRPVASQHLHQVLAGGETAAVSSQAGQQPCAFSNASLGTGR